MLLNFDNLNNHSRRKLVSICKRKQAIPAEFGAARRDALQSPCYLYTAAYAIRYIRTDEVSRTKPQLASSTCISTPIRALSNSLTAVTHGWHDIRTCSVNKIVLWQSNLVSIWIRSSISAMQTQSSLLILVDLGIIFKIFLFYKIYVQCSLCCKFLIVLPVTQYLRCQCVTNVSMQRYWLAGSSWLV